MANEIVGTETHDTLIGTSAREDIVAGAGHDHIDGRTGNDRIDAGDGHDVVFGGSGRDRITGGVGYDILDGGEGSDTYLFGARDWQGRYIDVIKDTGNGGRDRILATEDGTRIGLQNFDATSGIEVIGGRKFADVMIVGDGERQVWDFSTTRLWGIDEINAGMGHDIVVGSQRTDRLNGAEGNDILDGQKGNDILIGGLGQDILAGGVGRDLYVVRLGDGHDVITENGSAKGRDTLLFSDATSADELWFARDGENLLVHHDHWTSVRIDGHFTSAEMAVEVIAWDGGEMRVFDDGRGSKHDDLVLGDDDASDVRAGTGDDTVFAAGGDDAVRAGRGNDTVFGEAGNDDLRGQAGDDVLDGGFGSDVIRGGAGRDVLVSGLDAIGGIGGSDVFHGGRDADVFRFDLTALVGGVGEKEPDGFGADRILAFRAREGDRVEFVGDDLFVFAEHVDARGNSRPDDTLFSVYNSADELVGTVQVERALLAETDWSLVEPSPAAESLDDFGV